MRPLPILLAALALAPMLALAQVRGGAGTVKLPPPPPPPPPLNKPVDLTGQPMVTTPALVVPAAPVAVAPAAAPVFAVPVQAVPVPPEACLIADQQPCAGEAAMCLLYAGLEDTHSVDWTTAGPYVWRYGDASQADVEHAADCAADLAACLQPIC